MLAKRLARCGLAVSGGMLATGLSQKAASAAVPISVMTSTIKTVTLVAAGQAAATGLISAKVAALTEGVVKAMLFTKLKAAIAVVLILGFLGTGATILTCRTLAGQDEKKPGAEKPVEPKTKQEKQKEKETVTTWGKEVGGLQAGLRITGGHGQRLKPGEQIQFDIVVRNITAKDISFTDYAGKRTYVGEPSATNTVAIVWRALYIGPGPREFQTLVGAGREIRIDSARIYHLSQGKKKTNDSLSPGKYQIGASNVLMYTKGANKNPELATGTFEIELVKPGDAEQESFTAWGKEVGDLQAGLGFRPGEHRAYHHGETVTLVVRVRNVGKDTVKFKYIRQFLDENPPTATHADGKIISQQALDVLGIHAPVQESLEPGKETELESRLAGGAGLAGASGLRYELRPVSSEGKATTEQQPLFVRTGKVSLQYERLASPEIDPILSKLPTGKLELEVKEPKKGQALGQARDDPANIISKKDSIYPVLAEFRAAMQKREEEKKQVRSTFHDWIKVDSPAAAKLFPNLRFASLVWDMYRHPESKEQVGLAQGLEMVVAIDTKTNRLTNELWVHDNHEKFGKLLADYKVTLRDAAEAKLVWDASCDIYGQGSKTAPMKKISDSEWRFGIESHDQTTSVVDDFKTVVTRTYYMKVLVDPKTGQITSSGTTVDSSNKRKVPAK